MQYHLEISKTTDDKVPVSDCVWISHYYNLSVQRRFHLLMVLQISPSKDLSAPCHWSFYIHKKWADWNANLTCMWVDKVFLVVSMHICVLTDRRHGWWLQGCLSVYLRRRNEGTWKQRRCLSLSLSLSESGWVILICWPVRLSNPQGSRGNELIHLHPLEEQQLSPLLMPPPSWWCWG